MKSTEYGKIDGNYSLKMIPTFSLILFLHNTYLQTFIRNLIYSYTYGNLRIYCSIYVGMSSSDQFCSFLNKVQKSFKYKYSNGNNIWIGKIFLIKNIMNFSRRYLGSYYVIVYNFQPE